MEDPDAVNKSPDVEGAGRLPLELPDDLERQIVSMIVQGLPYPWLRPIKGADFKNAGRRVIVDAARAVRTPNGMPGKDVLRAEIIRRLGEKPDAIKIDYLGEFATCWTHYVPNVADIEYLRRQVGEWRKRIETKRALAGMIDPTKPSDIADTIRRLQEVQREAAGGGQARPFVDANDVLGWPDPVWLVPEVLVENAFGVIFGQPGCFKTFAALDLALSLAHGRDWLGHFPVSGEVPVAYITPEGSAGIKKRLQGWMESEGVTRLRNVVVNRHAFRLDQPDELSAVIDAVTSAGVRPRVLFIDTLARNFSGDENSTKEMSAFVNNVMEIVSSLGLAVVVVHHSGKDSTKGARGSIALTGAVDFSIEMVKSAPGRATVRCRKQKDAAEFEDFDVVAEPTGPSLRLRYAGESKAGDVTLSGDIVPVIRHLTAPLTMSEIVTATGSAKSTVERRVYQARDAGLVEKAGGHKWTLTAAGINACGLGAKPDQSKK